MQYIKLDKKDYLRSLLTDTAPGDSPIIFSNDGYYINSIHFEKGMPNNSILKIIFDKTLRNGTSQSNPYKYDIKKGELSLRTLSLIHPRSQYLYSKFYNEYSNTILNYCNQSPASIRHPKTICSSFYTKGKSTANTSYKDWNIDLTDNEMSRRHSSSYFSYRKYSRLYKFFNSIEYLNLEKKFSVMWMIDISNCFDSIYTHTISWAVKSKDYIKSHIDYKNQFCSKFDTLIQRSNNNETNGIPIGSEVSRIFSEIIFQKIDTNIINDLKENNRLEFGKDYYFLRYVDDFIIFSDNEQECKEISQTIGHNLNDYNLYIHEGKVRKHHRPFSTDKSNLIIEVKQSLASLMDLILKLEKHEDGTKTLHLNKVNNIKGMSNSFIGKIKKICSQNNVGYDQVSGFLVSTISSRLINLTHAKIFTEKDDDKIKLVLKIRDSIILLMDIMLFFYTVFPQVSTSYKAAKTIMIVDEYFKEKLPEYLPYYRSFIIDQIQTLPLTPQKNPSLSRNVSLEILNIITATSEFGDNYLIPQKTLFELINTTKEATYFTLVCLLYYIKTHMEYADIHALVSDLIIKKIEECKDFSKDSEALHLLLDSLSCPHLSENTRKKLLKIYLNDVYPGYTEDEITKFIIQLRETYWFVKWNDLDLIKLLQRKELNLAY